MADVAASPQVVAALVGALVTLLMFVMNRRIQRMDMSLKHYNAELAGYSTQLAAKMADLKEVELRNAAAHRVADMMLKRFEAVRQEVAELRSLLTLYQSEQGPFPDEVKRRVAFLCSSISTWVSPRGAFDEEFNFQLGHIREFFMQGGDYWATRKNFMGAFGLNCWMLVDAEFERISETIQTGSLAERKKLAPYKCEYVLPK